MKQTLYLMRHGQTLFNARGKLQGWCDAPLTELGVKQALNVHDYVLDQNIIFSHAYSSTLTRTQTTLSLVTPLPFLALEGLKEWSFGLFEGESVDLLPPKPYTNFFVNYGGESEETCRMRIIETLTHIMDQPNHDCVLVVSHGMVSGLFLEHFKAHHVVTPESKLKHGSLLKFEYEHGIFVLVESIQFDDQT